MKKFFYYALGAYLAIVPFAMMCLAMMYLSYTSIDNYTLAAIGVVLYTLYAIYFAWMFCDENLEIKI